MRWIPAHELYRSIGPEKGRGITLFHGFTGCDVVSAYRGKGKESAWQTQDVGAEADVFNPQLATVNDNEVDILDKCVAMMYKSSTTTGVNNARLGMFARKQRPYQCIPPTRSDLLQRVKRAAYQAGSIWTQSTLRQPETQSPADWGWAKNGDNIMWNVVWTMLPPIVESYQQVTNCGCKSECHGTCKCYHIGLSCTALCSCKCETP